MLVQPPLLQFWSCKGNAQDGRLGWRRWAWVYGEWVITCILQRTALWVRWFNQIWFPLRKLINRFFWLQTRWCILYRGFCLWGACRQFVWRFVYSPSCNKLLDVVTCAVGFKRRAYGYSPFALSLPWKCFSCIIVHYKCLALRATKQWFTWLITLLLSALLLHWAGLLH